MNHHAREPRRRRAGYDTDDGMSRHCDRLWKQRHQNLRQRQPKTRRAGRAELRASCRRKNGSACDIRKRGRTHLAAGLLESQGLECKVVSKLPNYVLGPYAGHCWSPTSIAPRQSTFYPARPPASGWSFPHPIFLPPRVLRVEVCPRCGSDQVGPPPRWHLMLLFLITLAWLPWVMNDGTIWYLAAMLFLACVLFWDRPNRCRACRHQWRGE